MRDVGQRLSTAEEIAKQISDSEAEMLIIIAPLLERTVADSVAKRRTSAPPSVASAGGNGVAGRQWRGSGLMTHRHQRDAVARGPARRRHLVVEAMTRTVAALMVCCTVLVGLNADVARSVADPTHQPIIVDGNTLGPAVQVFLDGRRAKGVSGLVVDDDVQATRAHQHADPKRLAHPRVQVTSAGDGPVR